MEHWRPALRALEGVDSLTSLNGFDDFLAMRDGTSSELLLCGTDLGLAVLSWPLLIRNASSLTKLDLRCS